MTQLEPLPIRKNLPRVLAQQEVDLVLAAAGNRRDKVMVLLVLDCGIRLVELANLRWINVGLDYMVVEGKVGRRTVPISEGMKRQLLGRGDGDHVWIGKKGPLTRSGVMLAYQRMFARANIGGTKLGPHTLRHTFGTEYVARGGNLLQGQEIMGHSNVTTTQIYVTLERRQAAEDHAKHSPVVTMGLLKQVLPSDAEVSF